MNRKMKGNDYILCKENNNTKTPTPKRSKKHNMTQIPIAQLCHTTLTMTQTFQLAVHQTYRTFKLDETLVHTETEESLSSNEDEVEAQGQTQKNTRRQYRKRQTTEWRTEQMHQYRARKQPQ